MKHLILIILLVIFKLASSQTASNKQLDSLESLINNMSSDSNNVKTLDKLSYKYSNINPEIGIRYAEEALKISRKINWTKGIGLAYLDLGMNYSKLSKFSLSLENYLKALDIFQNSNDKRSIAAVYANISLLYKSQSNYTKATEYSFKALSLKEYLNPLSEAIINENLGTIYLEQHNYDKTKQYYKLALESYKKLNNKEGIARNLGNNGIVLDAAGQFDEALEFHQKALKLNQEFNNKRGIEINYANIGYVYCHKKDFKNAIKYQKLALKLSQDSKFKSSIAINTGNIGETYYHIATSNSKISQQEKYSNLKNSIKYLEEAVEICKEINFVGPQLEFTQYISDAYKALNNHEEALDYYKMYDSLKNITESENSKIEISKLESQHELDIKNKDIIIKNKEILIAQLNAENSRADKIILVIGIMLISFISIYIVRKLRKRNQKQKNKLENIAKVQAHDIRGPVASILGLVDTFNFDNPTDPMNKKVIEYLKRSTEELDSKIKNIILEASDNSENE